MRLPDVLKAGTFRLALFFALAVTFSTSVVFLFIYWQVTTFDIKRLDVRLAYEVATAVSEPDERLKQALDLRLTHDLRRIDYAALFTQGGKLIYGNISILPSDLPIDGKTHAVDVATVDSAHDGPTPGLVAAARRPDGGVVVLGRSLYEVYALRQLVFQALMIGIVPASILAMIVGVIFSVRSSRRLVSINKTILQIMQGDLHERLPTRGRDDVDYVSSAVNLMLDEIVRLLNQIRSVGDNIAHDLRTPLALAHTRLERALAAGDTEHLSTAARQTMSDLDRALTTVTALLRISEVESGRRRSNFKRVDLAQACTNVFDLYEPLAEAKNIKMSLAAPEPVPILGDYDLMIEAIANLVDNAIKFTPDGGEVSIFADTVDGVPLIRIADSGPGIAPEDREDIFKRFYKSKNNKHLPGNGLGLSIAATIVEQHGLSLRAKDNERGAVFEITQRLGSNAAATAGLERLSLGWNPSDQNSLQLNI